MKNRKKRNISIMPKNFNVREVNSNLKVGDSCEQLSFSEHPKNKGLYKSRPQWCGALCFFDNRIGEIYRGNNTKSSLVNYQLLFIAIVTLIMVLSIIILIPKASAIGIVPGRTTLDFSPELEHEVEFSVINNEQKDMNIALSVQGELADYIKLKYNDKDLEFLSSVESKSLTYKVKLPKNLEPGLHTAEIVALEIPKANEKGTFVGATVAVVSQLHVYVACSGKCVDVDLNVLDAEQNSTAKFIVPVINRGKQKINEARAVIDIYSQGNKVGGVETDKLPIEPGARAELTGNWFVDVGRGDYKARITLYYDGEVKTIEKDFSVGKSMLEVERVWVSDFQLGGIAKFRILVQNRWNEELKQVYANLLIYNRNEVMSDLKSASENIPSQAQKELLVYWDTAGVTEGEYNGKLMVKYSGKSTDRELVLKVNPDSLDVLGAGYVVSSQAAGVSVKTIVIIVVILLVLSNVAWFVFLRRFIGKNKEKSKEVKV